MTHDNRKEEYQFIERMAAMKRYAERIPTGEEFRKTLMTQDRAEIVAAMARELLGRVNAPEQEIYRVAGDLADIAIKAAADIAMDHKGSAKRKRTERGLRLSKFSAYEQDEILAEERGEDMASEMIASAILALTSEGAAK